VVAAGLERRRAWAGAAGTTTLRKVVRIGLHQQGQRRKIDDAEARAEAKARRKEEKAQALAARNLPLPSA
jgi:hypothetical protein